MALCLRTFKRVLRKAIPLVLAGASAGLAPGEASAQQAYENMATAEGWVWALLQEGKTADLNDRCSELGAKAAAAASKDKPEWKDACRQLKPAFLVDVLTKKTWRDKLQPLGISISGAWIRDNIELGKIRLNHPLRITNSLIEANVILESARTDSDIAFAYSKIDGALQAAKLRSEMSLDLTKLEITHGVSLSGARIDGYVTGDRAVVSWDLDAKDLRLGVNLQMRHASFRNVSLPNAKVQGEVDLQGSTVRGNLDMSSVHASAVRLGWWPSTASSYKSVSLEHAQVEGIIDMMGAAVQDKADLYSVVATAIYMSSDDRYQSIFKNIDLINAKVSSTIELDGAIVQEKADLNGVVAGSIYMRSDDRYQAVFKNVDLTSAKVSSTIEFDGAIVQKKAGLNGAVADAIYMRSDDRHQAVFNDIDLTYARVTTSIEFDGATVKGLLSLNGVTADSVFLRSSTTRQASFQAVDLVGSHLSGDIDLQGATFGGLVSLYGAVAGRVFLQSTIDRRTTFKNVDLRRLKTSANLEMQGSLFDGTFSGGSMEIGTDLTIGQGRNDKLEPTRFQRISLQGTKVAGHLNMEGSVFEGDLSAVSLEVGGSLSLVNVLSGWKMDLSYIRVGGNLDASGAIFSDLNLTGADIKADLTLSKHGTGRTTAWFWNPPGELNLRNARAANLMDVQEAWPEKDHLHIDGFTFSRIGERRTPKWWDEQWIQRDLKYTPGPYEQIAAAFAAAGERGYADDMRFLGRVRQRETEKDWGTWIVLMFLEYVAGFGIGDYTFRVVYWVVVISTLGALYLWYGVPQARAKGQLWCFGAALSRLLPVIEINKEFTDFFNDPNRERLTGRQSAVFSAIGMLGWLLGAILVAAVAGLTQRP